MTEKYGDIYKNYLEYTKKSGERALRHGDNIVFTPPIRGMFESFYSSGDI